MEYQRRKNPLKNSARDLSVYCKKLIFNPPELAKWEVEGVRGRSKVRGWLHGVINSEGGAKRVESFTYSSAYFADFISFSQRGAPFHPAIPPSQKGSQKIPKKIPKDPKKNPKKNPKRVSGKVAGREGAVGCELPVEYARISRTALDRAPIFQNPKKGSRKDPEEIPKIQMFH